MDSELIITLYSNGYGLINLDGNIVSTLIGNEFESNYIINSLLLKYNLDIIDDANKGLSSHCISGNIFHGPSIYVQGSKVTPCSDREISINIRTECWKQPLRKSNQYSNNKFTATDKNTPLFVIHDRGSLFLDQAVIVSNFSFDDDHDTDVYYYKPLATDIYGIISFLDLSINDEYPMQIQFP
eukprot:378775_1